MKGDPEKLRAQYGHLSEDMLLLSREANQLGTRMERRYEYQFDVSMWSLGVGVSALTLHRWLSGQIQTEQKQLNELIWSLARPEKALEDFRSAKRLDAEESYDLALKRLQALKERLNTLTDDLYPGD